MRFKKIRLTRRSIFLNNPEAVVFDSKEFDKCIIGMTLDNKRAVYSLEEILEMKLKRLRKLEPNPFKKGTPEWEDHEFNLDEEAQSDVSFNTLGSLIDMGRYAPVIVSGTEVC